MFSILSSSDTRNMGL